MFFVPIIIQEYAGIDRINETVTVGIPFPKGLLKDISKLSLTDPDNGPIPVQTKVLAIWPDNSLKWILLDFQASVNAKTTKQLELKWDDSYSLDYRPQIAFEEGEDFLQVDTGPAKFFINTKSFKPFDNVIIRKNKILDSNNSRIVLTDDSGTEFEPLIDNIIFETKGPLKTTLKVEGEFRLEDKSAFASFFSRISFFANSSMIRMEFTILNPRAAKHPGGLWDLGDPGSVFFRDLSITTALKFNSTPPNISYRLYEDPVPMDYQDFPRSSGRWYRGFEKDRVGDLTGATNLVIYQDSSGGENWRSLNHVNRYGEVKNSFRGYRVYSDKKIIEQGLRANPVISIGDKEKKVFGAVKYFWQNFPKSLDAQNNTLKIGLFPLRYNDVFELQGGEQKTHTVFLDFRPAKKDNSSMEWCQSPLIAHATPEWYAESRVFSCLIPENEDSDSELTKLVKTAIQGNNTFFKKRDIIDQYGWRNFGEFYADHEAIGHEGSEPLISHYNNQYDCIYGALIQFLRSGDLKWFLLADQLCVHVKDIDIYHTDEDRPEFNRGLFWHTDHYIDAKTATHRCFSKKHAEYRNLATYGGGPALSHIYSKGFLLHYYMTGSCSSMDTVLELASFVSNNMDMVNTLLNHVFRGLQKTQFYLKKKLGKEKRVELDKVYDLNGPGRASGNALNTLLDAFILTKNDRYLLRAEDLICCCIHPDDDIDKRDLLDVENRWMYTVFLQSLCRYVDVKTDQNQFDCMWQYAGQSLIHYSKWMVDNEHLYLEKPEKLEYPNETWAAQDIRKCNILLYTSKYSESNLRQTFLDKAQYFYSEALSQFNKFETRILTRPIVLMLLYGMIYNHWKDQEMNSKNLPVPTNTTERAEHSKVKGRNFSALKKRFAKVSLKREFQLIKWKIISKL